MRLIKKIIGVSIAGVLIVPLLAGATYNDVSLTSDAIINVNSLNIGISSDSTTVIESITVSATSFTVTLQPNSTFSATSTDRATFSAEVPSALSQSHPCTSSESGLSLSGVSIGMTVTITPSSTACDASDSSSSSSGSSGGGTIAGLIGVVNTNTYPTVPSVPSQAQTPVPTIPQTSTAGSASSVSALFTTTMSYGASSGDVTRLQKLLSTDQSIYPEGSVT